MNGETKLLRQVHPNFVQAGRPTSQAFRPTPKDEYLLSVYDGEMIAPEPSWQHYTTVLGFQSGGVMAVTVAECAALGLPSRPDPQPFPEHAVVDFSGLEKNEIERRSKKLKAAAEQEGWLYRSP